MTRQDVTNHIENEIKHNRILLFMKGTPAAPQCGFSKRVVEILNDYPFTYKAIDVIAHPEIRAVLPEVSRWPTFPQLFIGGRLIGGCDIADELRDSGELKQIVEKAFEGETQA